MASSGSDPSTPASTMGGRDPSSRTSISTPDSNSRPDTNTSDNSRFLSNLSTPQQPPHLRHDNNDRDRSSRRQTSSLGAHDAPDPRPTTTQSPVASASGSGLSQLPTAALPFPGPGHSLPFVKPSSYLRRKPTASKRHTMAAKPPPMSPLDKEQMQGLRAIREFLKVRTSYDVLPLSFRLIVLDTSLLIKKSLNILIQNNIVSAPLWDSETSTFAGLLTSTDYINVIQYYCQFPDEIAQLDQFRKMLKTRARRIPLVDRDDETGRDTVVSVITQYRILKFIAVNNEHNTVLLKKPVRDIGLGTYKNLATARMNSTVLEAVHMMVENNISCIPIVDEDNRLLNAFEAVDIIPCIRGGFYEDLSSTLGEALCKRSDDSPGIYICTEDDRLDAIFDTIRKSRVHRLVVVDDENRLKGVISLSDVLKYVLLHGEEDDDTA
ncbi:hypothetical protein SAPIO_CDS8341 [Scedosporium apiospermum]|uniref:CBS domain-containing protein n=1 Tax=Pseudallescheria apiosperma TaxID=563466 RepID=A0A084FZE8_PSEDA|nr:uncharacterized protein SAPIO_CDS8341 [Scedosporium apiospermum]KEZ40460.1 hypothetical protein SAPIO_CDS8341 [Scedosporium apiospermum]